MSVLVFLIGACGGSADSGAKPAAPEAKASPEAKAPEAKAPEASKPVSGDIVCVTGIYVDPAKSLAKAKPDADPIMLYVSYPRFSTEGYKVEKYAEPIPVSRAGVEQLAKLPKSYAIWLKKTKDAKVWSAVTDHETECPPLRSRR